MQSIARLNGFISDEISLLKFPVSPAELYDPIRYTLGLGGKRIRPVLMLMGCELVGGAPEMAIKPALGVELFHNFTLLHDDIMDEAPLRRNKPTVYKKWNSNIAILSGDVLFAEAMRLVSKAPAHVLSEVMEVFLTAATQVCEGQQLDMNFELLDDLSISDYIQMINYKTAVLLGASLQIGVLCGGGSDLDSKHAYEFGTQLGIAFQLQDDVLDVFGDPAVFGKTQGGDITSNKKTYLKLRALEKGNPEQIRELKFWYSSKHADPAQKIAVVTELFNSLSIREEATEQMNLYLDLALENLDSINAAPAQKLVLENFARQLVVRTV
jgi:geranylgeranyl diphosphate synthase type II